MDDIEKQTMEAQTVGDVFGSDFLPDIRPPRVKDLKDDGYGNPCAGMMWTIPWKERFIYWLARVLDVELD